MNFGNGWEAVIHSCRLNDIGAPRAVIQEAEGARALDQSKCAITECERARLSQSPRRAGKG